MVRIGRRDSSAGPAKSSNEGMRPMTTPRTSEAESTDQVARNLAVMKAADTAFNNRDIDAAMALHHPDVVVHVSGNPGPSLGAAHRADFDAFLRAFPDAVIENDPYPIQFGQGDWITAVTRIRGTFSGELVGPDGKVIPGTGKPFDVGMTTIARIENGLLVEERAFVDQALLFQQIGLT